MEALTRVPELADKYAGQVKCIYIDPPFNTAQTFAHYEDNLQHSVWLTMMRDRLQHMHTLLSDEGSIWVHLDDVENHRMRVLLDEVFGPESFVAEVVWQKSDSPRRGDGFSVDQDNIIVYAKSPTVALNKMPRTEADNARFSNPDDDPNGPWWDDNPTANHGDGSGGMCYAIQNPLTGSMMRPPAGGSWRLKQETYFNELNKWVPYRYENLHDAQWRAQNEGVPVSKASDDVCAIVLDVPLEKAQELVKQRRSLPNLPKILIRSTGGLGRKAYVPQEGTNPRTMWFNDEVGHNRAAKSEIKALFPGVSPFGTPKPERLLERIVHIATNPGDIVLDIFGGSGTTAAVAQKMGRRWVTCELQEDNFTKFTRPRLEKVVRGEDQGGVTTDEKLLPRHPVEVPDKNTIKDLKEAALLLGRIADQDSLDAESKKLLKECKKLIAPKKEKKVNWRGGGSFTVARLSPACFDYDEALGLTLLTDAATGETLINSVAANLNFHRTPDDPVFHGIRGRMRLVVVEGTLLTSRVDELLAELADGELLTIANTEPDDTIRGYLRQVKRGCRMVHIPDDIFHATTAGLLADDTVQEA